MPAPLLAPMPGSVARRRTVAAAALAAAALIATSGCQSIVESVQGRPMNEIGVGQMAAGSIRREVDTRLRVTTHVAGGRAFATCWSETSGHGSGRVTSREVCSRGQSLDVGNEYARELRSVTGTTSLWRIDTAALARPARVLLLVRGRGFRPQAALFVDAAGDSVESAPGLALPNAGEDDEQVGGVIELDPKRRYLLTVQSGEPRDADFVVAVRVVTRQER